MDLQKDIKYIGVNDHDIDLFEGQYEVPNGMAYNSYVILDEKVAVIDTVDARKGDEWMANLTTALDGKTVDYLIVQHMEPDHSANIVAFTEKYPTAKIVASAKAFAMMKNFFGTDFDGKQVVVGEGSTLCLGKHNLTFITAPMVHWPEVIMTYSEKDKTLFSADAFGKFGALDYDDPEGWACEARRYYFGIVGKFGAQVQAVLKKVASFDIAKICALHGPVLDDNIKYYLDTYNTWSSYGVESEGVAIFFTSVYGHTKTAVEKLAQMLIDKGCPKVVVNDLAREDIYECVEDTFRYGKIVLATTTYNGGVFPKMKEFIEHLAERNYQNRKIAFIENGSWMPAAAKGMTNLLEGFKDITYAESKVTIKTSVTEETETALLQLADELK